MLVLRYVFLPHPYGFLLPKIMSASVTKNNYSKKRRQKDKEKKDFRKEKDQNDLEFGAQSIGSSSFPKTSHDEPLTLPLLKFHNISSLRHDFRSFHCYTGVGEKQKLLKFCDQINCIRSIHTSKSRLNF